VSGCDCPQIHEEAKTRITNRSARSIHPKKTSVLTSGATLYRREVDGLRALAVLPVLFFHAGFQTFSGGFVGVDVFFVISGYLITSIIEKQTGTFTLMNFYERRARRILPALFVVMFACVPFAWLWLLPSDMKEFSDSVLTVSTFISNILFWRTSGYFDTATDLKPLLHTWSLAVEEQYYLFFPIFLMLTWRLGKRWILVMLAVAAAVSLEAAQWGSVAEPAAAYYLLPTRGWELLIGVFLAFYSLSSVKLNINKAVSEVGGSIGLLLVLYAIFAFDKHTPSPSLYTLIPTIGTALIILCATQQTAVGKLLGNKLLVGVGVISYSAYLWHQPLLAFAKHRSLGESSKLLLGALVVAAVILAYFSWKYVEVPFRNKQRFGRKEIFKYGASLSAAFIVFGLVGNLTAGFLYRYDEKDRYLASLQGSEAGKYVDKRFDELTMKPFDASDSRKRILVIGDSFAKDLVNALYESGFTHKIQIATRDINWRCGNIFLERSAFVRNIAKDGLRMCEGKGLYEDAELRKLMLSSDEIWFASSWQYWQAELLQKSVANVEQYLRKRVKVFGTKSFGKVNIKELLSFSEQQRLASKSVVSADTIKTNALMKSTLKADVFVDIQELLCGTNTSLCALFQKGALISYDGWHLTKLGAKYCGDQLAGSDLLKEFAHSE
jgi:peptidoglycan/LPS O-acetylase OafA/YrhL